MGTLRRARSAQIIARAVRWIAREIRNECWLQNLCLTKHLLVHWIEGERWFWDCLLDADIASNACSWQWVAGSGADAAPYFRIFNPIAQGQKFDPAGEYVRRWCPELAELPKKFIHAPWEAPPMTLTSAGVTLGADYPHPIVDHKSARQGALDAYEFIKKAS